MAPKPDLNDIVARLVKRKQAKPDMVAILREASKPMLAELAQALAEATKPTEAETEDAIAQAQIETEPWKETIADPRKPWAPKGGFVVESGHSSRDHLPVQERIHLNNAIAKAKRGQRLTLKDRKLLGKYELAVIMAKLRRKVGDCG